MMEAVFRKIFSYYHRVTKVQINPHIFSINDQNRSQWKEIPTTLPASGTILGYREVFYMDNSPHAMVKVTELFPVAGRQHFAFYNINAWSSWTSITPS